MTEPVRGADGKFAPASTEAEKLREELVQVRIDKARLEGELSASEKFSRQAAPAVKAEPAVMTKADFDKMDGHQRAQYTVEQAAAITRQQGLEDRRIDRALDRLEKTYGSDGLFDYGKHADPVEKLMRRNPDLTPDQAFRAIAGEAIQKHAEGKVMGADREAASRALGGGGGTMGGGGGTSFEQPTAPAAAIGHEEIVKMVEGAGDPVAIRTEMTRRAFRSIKDFVKNQGEFMRSVAAMEV